MSLSFDCNMITESTSLDVCILPIVVGPARRVEKGTAEYGYTYVRGSRRLLEYLISSVSVWKVGPAAGVRGVLSA